MARQPGGRQRPARPGGRLRRRRRPLRIPVGDHLRHPHRLGRPAADGTRESALHAGRGARVADSPHAARRDLHAITTTRPVTTPLNHPSTDHSSPITPGAATMTTTTPVPTKKRLTTSAMIASFADPGQPTTPAPFGHALAELAEQQSEIVGLSADLAKYTDMH